MPSNIINPTEVCSVIRKKQFMVESNLSIPECEGHNPPLHFYSDMSMFKFIVINEQKKPVVATMRVSEILEMKLKSQFVYNENLRLSMLPKKEEKPKSVAYTVKISSGIFKGKTPAQILLEDSSKETQDRLTQQYLWLKEQLSNNPKFADSNKKQMEAIKEAANLLKEGKLSAENLDGTNSFTIYESGMRPQMRKQRDDGTFLIREMKIQWNFGDDYPVEILISNYYASVIKKENGMLNVQASKKNGVINNSIKLSAGEWMNAVNMIDVNMRTFEQIHAAQLHKIAKDASVSNYQNAKNNNQNSQKN